ncbi:CS012 protein, partial [Aegithalos caudatus]|nr:CS012 protein [Aegithalos caudatus]
PISVEDAMALLSHVASVEKLRIAYKHSQRGALLAGTAALAGGLLGGPPGIFIGGAVGGLLGWITSGQFKSVPQILKELPDAEKRKLYAAVKAVVKNLQWSDVSQLFHLAMANPTVRAKLVGVLNDY